jgi:hypothetical protein
MAKNETKHKSKWTKPKDEAKSLKPESRKDIKDYTAPDADGMVPNLSKGIQKLVPRNINGEVIDDVENMVPKIKDHIYKKVEDGDYSPEHARKVFEKLQIEDSEGYLDAMENGVYSIKESINRLSESQKEKLVRMYVRNKIAKVLREQAAPPADPLADPTAAPDAGAIPPADTGATPPADDTSGSNIESATTTFDKALKDEFLANATIGAEKAMKPLIQHYEANNDQKDEIAQGIANVLKSANITLPAASSTDHTKNDEPEQQPQV